MLLRAQFESHLLLLLRHRPAVHMASAKRLEALCLQQLEEDTLPEWQTFWSLASHFFTGLCVAPHRSFDVPEASATTQVLSGLLLREQFKDGHTPVHDNLQIINHLLFLEQADVISQRLVSILNDWSGAPEADMPHEVESDAHFMTQLAQDVDLTAIHQVADALSSQLARIRAKRVADDIKASLSGAQEVSRLLQHFAVGSVREPQPQVLVALRGE